MKTNVRLQLLVVLLLCCMVSSAYAYDGETIATCTNGEYTAEIKQLYITDNNTLNVYINFTNNSSDPIMYMTAFTTSVYQGGVECESSYFSNENLTTRIKSGATIDIKECFKLINSTDVIELTIGSWIAGKNPKTIYIDPVKNTWSSENPSEPAPQTGEANAADMESLKEQLIFGYFYPGMKKDDAVSYCKAIGCEGLFEATNPQLAGYKCVVVPNFPHKYADTPSDDTNERMLIMLLNKDDEAIVDAFMIH